MADDTNTDGNQPADTDNADLPDEPTSATDDEPLGEGGIKALRAERDRATQLERDLKAATARLEEIADAEKSDLERAQEQAAAAAARADTAERELMRAQVAAAKGLPADAMKRLTGSTREELEADADELLSLLTPSDPTPPPGGRPTRLHSGNGVSEDDGFDPEAIAARIASRHII